MITFSLQNMGGSVQSMAPEGAMQVQTGESTLKTKEHGINRAISAGTQDFTGYLLGKVVGKAVGEVVGKV